MYCKRQVARADVDTKPLTEPSENIPNGFPTGLLGVPTAWFIFPRDHSSSPRLHQLSHGLLWTPMVVRDYCSHRWYGCLGSYEHDNLQEKQREDSRFVWLCGRGGRVASRTAAAAADPHPTNILVWISMFVPRWCWCLAVDAAATILPAACGVCCCCCIMTAQLQGLTSAASGPYMAQWGCHPLWHLCHVGTDEVGCDAGNTVRTTTPHPYPSNAPTALPAEI